MKVVNIREARASLADLVEQAQRAPICVTRHGRPVAIITGIEGADLGSVILENSKEFWDEVERRRRSKAPRSTIEEIRKRYAVPRRRKSA